MTTCTNCGGYISLGRDSMGTTLFACRCSNPGSRSNGSSGQAMWPDETIPQQLTRIEQKLDRLLEIKDGGK